MCTILSVQIGNAKLLTGWKLTSNQVLAMFMKRGLITIRSWVLLLLHIAIPAFLVWQTVQQLNSKTDKDDDLSEHEISLGHYDQPVTILGGAGAYKTGYLDILKNNNSLYEDIGNEDIYEYILEKTTKSISMVRQRYILAAICTENSITALFNNEPYHSPPLAISVAVNAILRSKLGADYRIRFTNHPAPLTINSRVSFKILQNLLLLLIFLCFRLRILRV